MAAFPSSSFSGAFQIRRYYILGDGSDALFFIFSNNSFWIRLDDDDNILCY